MSHWRLPNYTIQPWQPSHDATAFSSGMESIDKYIRNQALRDMSNRVSLVFVLTDEGDNVIHGYYTLSSLSVIFAELPEKLQKRLPRYPQIGATLLGRLGVDRNYSETLTRRSGERPRIGELLLTDSQIKTLQGSATTAGSAMLVIDALKPTDEETANGLRDPIGFYEQYGFTRFPGNPRRLFKTTRAIELELKEAGIL